VTSPRLAWAALLASPLVASAHAVDHPRRILLDVSAAVLVATFEYALAPSEAASVRRLFDRDRDGRVGPGERDLLVSYLGKRARGSFALACAGRDVAGSASPVELADVDGTLGLGARVAVRFNVSESDCTLSDDGGSEGHVPVRVAGARVRTEAPRGATDDEWTLPARRPVRFRFER
jgi:hypothetical protein